MTNLSPWLWLSWWLVGDHVECGVFEVLQREGRFSIALFSPKSLFKSSDVVCKVNGSVGSWSRRLSSKIRVDIRVGGPKKLFAFVDGRPRIGVVASSATEAASCAFCCSCGSCGGIPRKRRRQRGQLVSPIRRRDPAIVVEGKWVMLWMVCRGVW